MTDNQRSTILNYLYIGAIQDKKDPNIIWYDGHCIRVHEDGSAEEL